MELDLVDPVVERRGRRPRSRAPISNVSPAAAARSSALRSDLRKLARAPRQKPVETAVEARDVAHGRLAATALPARRQCGVEGTPLRAGDSQSRQDHELPVTPAGKNRHDLLDQRDGIAPDQRRGEPPRELDRLDVREPRRVDPAHRREVAVLAPERERGARRHQRPGSGQDPGAGAEQNRSIAGVNATS